jgi:7-cyano-7-deazaguanine synthase
MKIEAPMMDLSMAQMLQLGLRLEVPFEQTWSCHLGGPRPCGRCSGCKQRARSFAEIARLDPLLAGAANRPARSTAAQAR